MWAGGRDLAELYKAECTEAEDCEADAGRHHLGVRVRYLRHQLQQNRRRGSRAHTHLPHVQRITDARPHTTHHTRLAAVQAAAAAKVLPATHAHAYALGEAAHGEASGGMSEA